MKLPRIIFLFSMIAFCSNTFAQRTFDDDTTSSMNSNWKWQKGGNFYFAWGYSKYWYTKSDIHVQQNFDDVSGTTTKTEYTLVDVKGHDRLGIEKLYNVPLTVPQFNVRIGYFFNKKQDLGIELNYDHAKFISADDQYVEMKGSTNGVAFDSTAHLYTDTAKGPKPFIYKLNNGANFVMVNLVKRFELYNNTTRGIHFSYLAKFGGGITVPHVENTIFGMSNDPHFQFPGGWCVGVESALRCVFFNRMYIEFGQKGTFANYYKLRIYKGLAKQSFGAYEVVLTLGVNFPAKKYTHGD